MPGRVSEKSLELNVSADILALVRASGYPRAYLRGLTQAEENAEGADSVLHLDRYESVFAFQFKATRNTTDEEPYKFTINRRQHDLLFDLVQHAAGTVYYVFPQIATLKKLLHVTPAFLDETYFVPLDGILPAAVFGQKRTTTVYCEDGKARINPEVATLVGAPSFINRIREIRTASSSHDDAPGNAHRLSAWYNAFVRARRSTEDGGGAWLGRGLRVVICPLAS